jgi:hypothetical protein
MRARASSVGSRLSAIVVLAVLLAQVAMLPSSGVGAPSIAAGPRELAESPDATTFYNLSSANFTPRDTLASTFLGVDVRPDARFNASDALYLADAGVKTWRYPGGAIGEAYNYTANCREPTCSSTEPNGIYNFIHECLNDSCNAILQLPAEIDSPSTDGYYVSYVVHTLGFHPAVWEIGNEPCLWTNFGQAWSQWSTPGTNATPGTFAATLPTIIAAIREQDPTTPISGLGGTGCGSTNNVPWVQAVAEKVGAEIQYVSLHSYIAGGTKSSASSFLGEVHGTYNQSFITEQAAAGIHAVCVSCSIGVLVTEAGASNGQSNFFFETNFPMAVWDAAALSLAGGGTGAAPGVSPASIDDYAYDNGYPGSFTVNNPSVTSGNLDPSYYFYKDLAQFIVEGTVLNATLTPSTNTLYAFACVSTTGDSKSLLLTNVGTTGTANVSLYGSGFPLAESSPIVTWYTWNLTGAALEQEPVVHAAGSLTSVLLPPESVALVAWATPLHFAYPPPAAPIGLFVSGGNWSRTSSTAHLSWDPSAGPVTNVSIDIGTPSASAPYCTVSSHVSAGPVDGGYTLTGLTETLAYCFGVRSWNAKGGSSESNFVNVTTNLAAPTNFKATSIASSYINFSWTNPSPGAPYSLTNVTLWAGYNCTSPLVSFSVGTVHAYRNVSSLRIGEIYCFWVTGWTSLGAGGAAYLNITTLGGNPSAPVLSEDYLQAGNASSFTFPSVTIPAGALVLGALEVRTTATGYSMSDPAGNTFKLERSLQVTSTNLITLALFAVVNAKPAAGEAVTCKPNAASPSSCQLLVFTNVPSTESPIDQLGWGRASLESGVGGLKPFDFVNATQVNDTLALFAGESVGATGDTFTSGTATVLLQGGAHTTASSVLNGTVADKAATASTLSNYNLSLGTAVTGSSAHWAAIAVSVRGSSGATEPTNLSVVKHSLGYIDFNWTNPLGVTLTNDTIYYSTNNVTFTARYTGAVGTSYNLTGLTANTTYYLYVQAAVGGKLSGESIVIQSETDFPPPSAPIGVRVSELLPTGFVVVWVNPTGFGPITNDTVYLSTDDATFIGTVLTPAVETDTVVGLTPGVVYYLYVTATDAAGEGTPSPTISTSPYGTAFNLSATETKTTITLGWQGWGSPTNDTVYLGYVCSSWIAAVSTGGAATLLALTGLEPGTQYCLAVQEWSGSIPGALSSPIVVLTNGTVAAPPGGLFENPFGIPILDYVYVAIAGLVIGAIVAVWEERSRFH